MSILGTRLAPPNRCLLAVLSLAAVALGAAPAPGQDAALEGVRKRQTQLETIARRVYALAQTGHPEATRIVQELARRGVTISPDAPAAAPAPPKSP